MKESQRIEQMNEGAALLRSLPSDRHLTSDELARLANIALGMEKFAAFVLDRDAGPTRDVVSENRRLARELVLANSVAKELDLEYAAYRDKTKGIHHKNAMLNDDVTALKDQLAKAQKAAPPTPTKIPPEESAKTES